MLPYTPEELESFWNEHQFHNPAEVLLKAPSDQREHTRILLDQVASMKKLKDKVPEWTNRFDLWLPPVGNLSQSSSTLTAKYKAQFVSGKMIDLTAGSGIDAWKFAQNSSSLDIVEPNEELLQRTKWNLDKWGVNANAHCTTAEEFIESTSENFDCIFLDPSRKSEDGKKTVALHRMVPDLNRIWNILLEKGNLVMVKLSPLFDLTAIVNELPGVYAIDIVSKRHEVKEVLIRAKQASSESIEVSHVEVQPEMANSYSALFDSTKQHPNITKVDHWEGYLYDPSPGMIKAGLSEIWASEHQLAQPYTDLPLYVCSELIQSFPGRIFRINTSGKPYKIADLPKQLSIVSRNYFESPDQIRKKLKVKESKDEFLFAVTEKRKKPIFIHATRVL